MIAKLFATATDELFTAVTVPDPSTTLPSVPFPFTATVPVPKWPEVAASFFYADVTTERLRKLTTLFDARKIHTRVGSVLPLAQARHAHEMLAGAPHRPGKIVLEVMQSRWSPVPGADAPRT